MRQAWPSTAKSRGLILNIPFLIFSLACCIIYALSAYQIGKPRKPLKAKDYSLNMTFWIIALVLGAIL